MCFLHISSNLDLHLNSPLIDKRLKSQRNAGFSIIYYVSSQLFTETFQTSSGPTLRIIVPLLSEMWYNLSVAILIQGREPWDLKSGRKSITNHFN